MAQTAVAAAEPHHPPVHTPSNFLRKLFGRSNGASMSPAEVPREVGAGSSSGPDLESEHADDDESWKPDMLRRVSRKVVPGLPRAQTFKRQQSEKRTNLAPVQPTPDERRAVSVDRRVQQARATSQPTSQQRSFPRASAPELLENACDLQSAPSAHTSSVGEYAEYSLANVLDVDYSEANPPSIHEVDAGPDPLDNRSITTSQYDDMIHDELERKWILNLSMHFRDKSKREKFFVTYRENESVWRRVTVSLDYRNAPDNSLELDLSATRFQRDKSAKIYEAIRESLQDIQFYDSVTNLKLQTTDGRLHVHVVEDTNEIINYPPVRQVQHLGCRRIRESQIEFDAHMSGFVYRVRVAGETLIKKEIPGPETVDEFLYEINALHSLRHSADVIRFYGVVVDDQDESVKGLLISYADQGALVDVLYDNRQDSELGTPWDVRERWARQIVQGLAEIHECGFVQGDFTLSNIVVDDFGDAKIIDINRRGCPVGWEPPEATPLIESGQRLAMYIGVKSDLFQLGMVLWALATQEDEPEVHGRPLRIGPDISVPDWFRKVVDTCLSDDPRQRLQATSLLSLFPEARPSEESSQELPTAISVDDGYTLQEYFVETYNADGHASVKTVKSPGDWSYVNLGHAAGYSQDPYYYSRGRSPPSPLSSHYGHFDNIHKDRGLASWARATEMPHSYSDAGLEEMDEPQKYEVAMSTTSADIPAVFVEMPDVMAALPARKSGVLTPESLAVEHHVYGTEDGTRTPTPRPVEEKVPNIAQPVLAPASIPLPLSPVGYGDAVQNFDVEPELLDPVPDDLLKLDQMTTSANAEGLLENGETKEVAAVISQIEMNQKLGEQVVQDPTGPGEAHNQHGEAAPLAAGAEQDEKQQFHLDLDSGLTVPEGGPNNSNGTPSDETDSTTKPGKPDDESGEGQPVSERDDEASKDAIHGTLAGQDIPDEVQEAPGDPESNGGAEPSELKGVGAAHLTSGAPQVWETTLKDDDFEVSTAATQPSTTATTERQP